MNVKSGSRLVVKWLVAISMLYISGCACFPGNKVPQVSNLPPLPEGTKKQTVSYLFSSGSDVFGKNESAPFVRTMWESELVDVIRESGYFATWGPGSNGDITIEARLVNSGNPAALIPAFITGFTLYMVPSWATDTFTVTAKIKTRDGEEYPYQLEDSTTLVQWLPMIFVPGSIMNIPGEVRKNIWKNLILKMHQDGLLRQTSSVSPGKTLIEFHLLS